jgi:hypothetical protein
VGVPISRMGCRVLVSRQRAFPEQVAQGAGVAIRADVARVSPASWAALFGSTLAPSRPWARVSSIARSGRSPSLIAWVSMVVLLWSPSVHGDIRTSYATESHQRVRGP